ncbi:MAG TPA: hypothetical protein PLA88_01410 [Bacteroidales bacterium]|nr:hypothetical protein [Bacteroidales bacterium]
MPANGNCCGFVVLLNATAPMAVSTAPAPKLAVAEKHIGMVDFEQSDTLLKDNMNYTEEY